MQNCHVKRFELAPFLGLARGLVQLARADGLERLEDDVETKAKHLHDISENLHILSIVITGFFLTMVFLKLAAHGKQFFRDSFEVFDGFVIIISFVSDIVFMFTSMSTASMIVLLFLRVLRIMNALMMHEKQRYEFRIALQKRARRVQQRKMEILQTDKEMQEKHLLALEELCKELGCSDDMVRKCKPKCESDIISSTQYTHEQTNNALKSIAALTTGFMGGLVGAQSNIQNAMAKLSGSGPQNQLTTPSKSTLCLPTRDEKRGSTVAELSSPYLRRLRSTNVVASRMARASVACDNGRGRFFYRMQTHLSEDNASMRELSSGNGEESVLLTKANTCTSLSKSCGSNVDQAVAPTSHFVRRKPMFGVKFFSQISQQQLDRRRASMAEFGTKYFDLQITSPSLDGQKPFCISDGTVSLEEDNAPESGSLCDSVKTLDEGAVYLSPLLAPPATIYEASKEYSDHGSDICDHSHRSCAKNQELLLLLGPDDATGPKKRHSAHEMQAEGDDEQEPVQLRSSSFRLVRGGAIVLKPLQGRSPRRPQQQGNCKVAAEAGNGMHLMSEQNA
ncbi:Voltage-gated hydrogen channel 1 [Cichlidogyrus casuarinus]|uniref:Voltage-gated hydrogen channel 1 n=1 Tax=Cichlidogyrus casuarinus TaxID=1844966 RepID=A0ABD2QNU3_9PLAT